VSDDVTADAADSARERILEAAVEEFAHNGLAAVRVDAVARTAGVNKQLIYYYFKSKIGLREAVLERMVREYRPFWDVVANSSLPHLLSGLPDNGPNDRWRRVLAWEGVEYADDSTREIVLEQTRSQAYGTQTEVLQREQEAGSLPSDIDAQMLSLVLVFARMGPFILPQVTRMIMGRDATVADTRKAIAATLESLIGSPPENGSFREDISGGDALSR
jgi:TetR/AcrR family transcriptional regulator